MFGGGKRPLGVAGAWGRSQPLVADLGMLDLSRCLALGDDPLLIICSP